VTPRTQAGAWPSASGAWLVATVNGARDLAARGAVTQPIPSRHEIDVDGVHYTFASDINGTIFYVRFLLPGAAERRDDVRAWLGNPTAAEITIRGDQIELERALHDDNAPRLRALHAALRALDDELVARHADPHGRYWYDFDDARPERLTLEYISWDFCPQRGEEIIAGFRSESPTSPRRLALARLGFVQVACQWTRTYQTYAFP
jgi:hypothetical protein